MLAPCPIPPRWHHVFTPVCSVPEPSRMKLLLMSFGVTNKVCLWEFYKTHTKWPERTVPPIFLTMEGQSRLWLGPIRLDRTEACSVFHFHWFLRRNHSQTWVFWVTLSTHPPSPPMLPLRIYTRRWIIHPVLVSVVSGWGICRCQLLGAGLNPPLFSGSWITVLLWLLSMGLARPLQLKETDS